MSPVRRGAHATAAIGDAKTCPHGHPIFEGARELGVPLADVEEGATVHGPPLRERGRGPAALPQGAGLRARAARARWPPGTTRRSSSTPGRRPARSPAAVAETVSVLADPSPPPRTALPDQLVLGKERYGRQARVRRRRLGPGRPRPRRPRTAAPPSAPRTRSSAATPLGGEVAERPERQLGLTPTGRGATRQVFDELELHAYCDGRPQGLAALGQRQAPSASRSRGGRW